MRSKSFILALLAGLAWGVPSLHAQDAATAPTTQPDKFIRFVDRGPAGGELDTADVAFSGPNGQSVHLVAAVHVGEASYYQNLSKSFEGYDAVLYELILSQGATPPSGHGEAERSDSAVTQFQLILKNTLNLDYQLDAIDYTRPNFVHADLDRETFEKMEADRGESMWSLMLKQMMDSWQNPPPEAAAPGDDDLHDLVKMVCRPDGQRQLKLVLAKEMDQMEEKGMGMDAMDGTVILTERNKAAMSTLQKTLDSGKKNVAVFYGAAHMPDLTHRLEDMGFTPTHVDWHMAWDLSIRADQPSMAEQALDKLIDAIDPDN
jgi:hypothetical protein